MDVGGLDLRVEEGREGDMGDQCGAGVVDEGVDLLCLLTAGFDLENRRAGSVHAIFKCTWVILYFLMSMDQCLL